MSKDRTNREKLYDLIKKPLITEKSVAATALGQYTFEVDMMNTGRLNNLFCGFAFFGYTLYSSGIMKIMTTNTTTNSAKMASAPSSLPRYCSSLSSPFMAGLITFSAASTPP